MFPLFFITDFSLISGDGTPFEVVAHAMDGGARLIQYRDKHSSRRALYENAKKLREMTSARGVTFVINDQIDLAHSVRADGVHLGQDDLPLGVARKLLGENAIIGISTHTLEEAIQAERDGANYIGFGPIFSTKTKADSRPAVGIKAITEIKREIKIPLYAIGGITLDHLAAIFSSGANGVAVISAMAGDVRSHVEEWIKAISTLMPR